MELFIAFLFQLHLYYLLESDIELFDYNKLMLWKNLQTNDQILLPILPNKNNLKILKI